MKKVVSSIMLSLLIINFLTLAFKVPLTKSAWTGTVYIRADGSIDPPDASITTYDNITYTLTDNITSTADGIVVERDNIIIDGNGFTLLGNRFYPYKGIDISRRYNVTINNTNIKNFDRGIYLYESSNNSIIGNTITNNDEGIYLGYSCSYNSIIGNTITNNGDGIFFRESFNNSISGNSIANNVNGISLVFSSDNNSISGNNITNNWWGIQLFYSFNNRISGNNFINNDDQVSAYGHTNVWDDGYPSGGNYWSDYVERYPDAEELDGSGLWDTPYVIDENNRDGYPLMYPYGTETYKLTISTTSGGTTNPSPGTHTYASGTIAEVTAVPDINYTFAYWELDGLNVGSNNPIEVLMNSNHTLHAVFAPILYYELTISTTPRGTTNPAPGIYTYVNGTQVVITAVPYNGYSFDYWLLDGVKTTQNPITIIMNANHTLEAYFVDDIPPEISDPWQDPPPNNVQPLQNVTVRVNVTDYGTGIKNVTLWYSLDNGTSWTILNMTALPIPSDTWITYEATIDGYENCTWVTYKIIAYDNAGNNATKDNNGYGYKYHVIPEFPSTIVSLLLLMLIAISLIFIKQRFFRIEKREV